MRPTTRWLNVLVPASDQVPPWRLQVRASLGRWSDKGDTQRARGKFEAAIAAYDEVVERFGASDAPEVQVPVAWALSKKGDTQRERGEFEAALAVYDEVVERFGASDAPEIQVPVAWALVDKGVTQIEIGRAKEALHTCEELEQRLGILPGDEKTCVRVASNVGKDEGATGSRKTRGRHGRLPVRVCHVRTRQ